MALAFVVYAIGVAAMLAGATEVPVTGWAAFAVASIGFAVFCLAIYIEENAVQSDLRHQAEQQTH